ncbi:MAG: metallopeptidase family protein [Propionicimonas sp.]|uniref:metallopeptidase family protein n=1 Tax=Propionicimonas sp. TaxID=1955623 RepID=UPI003D122EFD
MRRRERHGRGVRGPLAAPNPLTGAPVPLRQRARGADFFADCLRASVARTARTCPRALVGIDIGYEEVPGNLEAWRSVRVPLAAAVPARPGQNGQVVLFRRPLEHRAASRAELRRLVHRALLEQLSALTGIGVEELDPSGDLGDDWD